MLKMKQISKLLLSFLLIFICTFSFGQRLESFKLSAPSNNYSSHSLDTILIPFWDDFSGNDSIENNIWSVYESLSVKDYYNINAPSLNVIEFDGLNKDGIPYNYENGYGVSDILESDKINLNNFNLQDSLYLSFYWNYNINGELPDNEDSLKVEFLDKNNVWKTVWVKNGGNENHSDLFSFESILISPDYLHQNFMFKLYNKGNTEGPFDSWLVDYFYLDKNRSKYDSLSLDRTISYKGFKVLNNHISVPFNHLSYADSYADSIVFSINNLDNQIQPINYSFEAYIKEFDLSFIYSQNKELSPILGGNESRNIINNPIKLSDFKLGKDSIEVDFSFYIESGDSTYLNKNLILNDTTNFQIKFSDFYSYDDGKAEYAAGLNQKNSELVLEHFTFTSDTLTHIQILFPETIENTYTQNIELVIYKKIDNESTKLRSQNVGISYDNNNFNTYKLDNPLIVEDTFYIGFKQFESNFLSVGLDKNNNTSDKIFYKIDNQWEQNDIIKGSLMIRPIFKNSDLVISGINEKTQPKSIIIFPNPSNGIFYLSKKVEKLKVLDSKGSILLSDENTDEINLSRYSKGIYYLIIMDEKNQITKKLIIN
ncbi:MAG: hypothetical protein CND83_02605 [Rhodothermaeota bacterium MED-G19]|nr:MAG: hypothetical protein CND83_02605 [Rhodothermaeota bacterium MED-G19]